MVKLGRKSTVARASSNSPSVRATIPEEVVKEMQLTIGDVLDWEIEERKNRKVMIVRKLE
jgi:antitoxin component of MazEF toxin-antitoxin module